MNIQQQVRLDDYSTMGLGGPAAFLTTIEDRIELLEALSWAQEKKLPVIMIGGGSNILWRDEGFPGLVIVNHMKRYEISGEDQESAFLTAGAGEIWDEIVAKSVASGLSGIEALSLIPGTVGATPIQNVGAYGQEVSQTISMIEAFDIQAKDFVMLRGEDCGFSYRNSRFKSADRGRFYITAVTFHLQKLMPTPPYYAAVERYLADNKITEVTPAVLRQAVIAIRQSRLPDPAKVHNNGSFFANPIVSAADRAQIQAAHPDMPLWRLPDGSAKLSAAWMIEQAGFKDFHDDKTGMATWPAQPLVLINENAKTTAQLLEFKQTIVDAVREMFGVTLVQEPELLP
jgi:UDP-N-acetylmuramate dehydrogenase